ncbi:hypothetical protein GMA19_01111 [Paenibacillus polymyxa E681]|uniref:hypothetical protein n=1 Tax=Paenibacillus polymyxa TaxID=1406 RepID=UPI0001E311F9|nr:hypothetical protein [Paenibacillus polymyxa]ADM68950.1 hypothetical protein PPE_01102 [Paenibacillus polymyxa E681]QNV55958.1 hypothetical protein GE561_01111 [Paenibacillus polymyxa E681]QNV60795.1 hypothetical protein GMA19_01111 [Paenibacillus polymyxa E681]
MASEKTPNLGLNQIDRTSPKTTYFDLEKYLDQNWRAVDDFAGDVNDGVNAIKKRLDTTERKALTLEPGVQIVHAEKTSPFSLTGLSGRMLVNLLGRAGSGDQIGSLLGWEADLAVDTSNKAQGMGSIKVTAKNATGVYNVYSSGLKLTGGRYYIALADVKNINASNNIYVNFSTGGNKALKQSIDKSQFVTIYTKCAPANDTAINLEVSAISTATGQAFYADAIRLYEISASEYAALDSMIPEQIAAKYPYVDSVMPVRNPYAIRYGENLIPPFYEWTLGDRAKPLNPYKLETVATVSVDQSNVYVPVSSGSAYTFTAKVNGRVTVVEVDALGTESTVYSTTDNENRDVVVTFTTKTTTKRVRVYATNTGAGTFTLENPMLNIGSAAKPFRPRENSMLALQTDLYADPVTGANADTVFERDGQYFKAKKWRGLTLDGSFPWRLNNSSYTGYKRVAPSPVSIFSTISGAGYAVKFDGKILKTSTVTPGGGDELTWIDTFQAVTVANSDSGWGQDYSPSDDEIKAYFMGWRMFNNDANVNGTVPYNGTGTKAWGYRLGGGTNNLGGGTATLPTGTAPNWTPYQLVYQLATPTVEPIVSEGQITFIEGDNQVEVGTGIVVRESAKPVPYDDNKVAANRWAINKLTGLNPNPLKNKPSKILAVYGNGFSEPFNWGVASDNVNWYGNVYIDQLYAYGADKSYSVTYLMAATSPIVPFTGSYTANEKTLITDLVDSIQQNTARVSVLENKKADKDSPAWITPTLLNGWATSRPVGIMKDSNGFVHIKGLIANGLTNGGLALFTLPQGYRPISIQGPVSYGYGPSGPVFVPFDIFPDGRVCFGGGGAKDSTTVSVLFPPFIAEQ